MAGHCSRAAVAPGFPPGFHTTCPWSMWNFEATILTYIQMRCFNLYPKVPRKKMDKFGQDEPLLGRYKWAWKTRMSRISLPQVKHGILPCIFCHFCRGVFFWPPGPIFVARFQHLFQGIQVWLSSLCPSIWCERWGGFKDFWYAYIYIYLFFVYVCLLLWWWLLLLLLYVYFLWKEYPFMVIKGSKRKFYNTAC